MSRLTGKDALGMFEAYNAVYTPQELTEEQVWEEVENWVNSLVEEGYDLSEYTWEDMYEEYLEEKVDYNKPLEPQLAAAREKLRTAQATRNAPAKPAAAKPAPQLKGLSVGKGGFNVNNKPVQTGMSPIFQRPGQAAPKPSAAAPAARAAAPAARAAAPAARAAAPATRPAPSTPSGSKSTPSAPAAKSSGSAMDTWAKANPKLAAAAAEKARIRGTAQSDNPLMKNMRSKLPVTPTVQSSSSQSLGKGNQSLTQNPNAGRSPAPKAVSSAQATAATTKPVDNITPAQSKIASAPKPSTLAPKSSVKEEHDAFDIVLEYLLSQGHVDTVEEAHYVMLEMDPEFIQDIISESGYFPTPESQRADEAKYRKMRNPVPSTAKTKGRFIPGDDRMPGQPARPTTIPGK